MLNTGMMICAMSCGLAVSAGAQEVIDCDWQARADAIAEPWDENTATFANGAVRLAILDTIEPAAGAFHMLVLSPPYDELGGRQCKTIGVSQGIGFAGLSLEGLEAEYDAEVGLIFQAAASFYDPETADFLKADLFFTVNQATGQIEAFLE